LNEKKCPICKPGETRKGKREFTEVEKEAPVKKVEVEKVPAKKME
jgi:hypothetical protein